MFELEIHVWKMDEMRWIYFKIIGQAETNVVPGILNQHFQPIPRTRPFSEKHRDSALVPSEISEVGSFWIMIGIIKSW